MKLTSREMHRIAGLIDRVVGDMDVRSADAAARDIVRREARSVLDDIASMKTQGAARLTASLKRLIVMMEASDASQTPVRAGATLSLKTLARAFAALAGGAVAALPVFAAAASIGDEVIDPTTGKRLEVVEIVDQGFVVKDSDAKQYFVYSPPAVGTEALVHIEYDENDNPTEVRSTILRYTVEGGGTASSVSWVDGFPTDGNGKAITGVVYGTRASTSGGTTIPETVLGTVTVFADLGGGVDEHSTDIPANTGDQGRINQILAGKNGSNGRTGAVFVPASSGGAGARGGDVGSAAAPRTIGVNNPVVSVGAANAPGVIVASIGGNGGKGGSSYLNLAGGGKSGGRGGSGGDVNVKLNGSGSVATSGQGSHGVVMQSRAGVGGNGGSGWAATGGGGAGGNAASGGAVVADVNLKITTQGDGSHGLLVQSLGGGAGNSGSSYGLFGATTNGGWGGDGGDVTATSRGDITTSGAASHGVIAQSIGGTGGDAGATGGIVAFGGGGAVNLTVASGTITTKGDGSFGVVAQSTGFVAQSLGGGGGNGGFNVSGSIAAGLGAGAVSVGIGGGGGGGDGGYVNAAVTDAIYTKGALSGGFVAQSIGGGGGNGAYNVSGSIAGGLGAGSASVGFGGFGAQGGDGGEVWASAADIRTEGLASTGFLAQSVGGGGFNVSGAIAGGGLGAGAVSVGLGGFGGGDGDLVNATIKGDVVTLGALSSGIVAQSIGGGGGNGGFNVSGGIGGGIGAGTVNVGLGGPGAGGGVERRGLHQ